jgi:LAO/AO transport system kinase
VTKADLLAEQVLQGSRRALARLITQVENDEPAARAALAALYRHTGRAHIVGVTGAPGTGKSTLVNEIAKEFRRGGETVGIVAVDPTSPFSGGAVLGDRIRMRDLAGDEGIFIRSMASRGSLGGLARATGSAVKLLDAAGFDIVIVETVGAGQSEVDIAKAAHTTLVIQAPGMGDDIQAIKAGILEIADIFVVNKADLPGAEQAVKVLEMMQRLGRNNNRHPGQSGRSDLLRETAEELGREDASAEEARLWEPPILQTVSTSGEGVEELVAAIRSHRAYLRRSGELAVREAARVEVEFAMLLREALLRDLVDSTPAERISAVLARVLARELDPYTAVAQLVAER